MSASQSETPETRSTESETLSVRSGQGQEEPVADSQDARARILAAAARLIAEAGRDAATTRAVAAAAGVQAPTLYRLFGDKQGLLDAVTAYGFERYLAEKKTLVPSDDPVADLKRGWDNHVEFGLTHPAFYVLM